MRHARSGKRIKVEAKYALIAAVVGVFIVAYALLPAAKSVKSVEVSFTDASKSGLEIMPASCASGVPPYSGDNKGYVISPGASNNEINSNGDYFCVSNTSGNTYYIPANTKAEIDAFLNKAASLPGVSVQNPGPDNP